MAKRLAALLMTENLASDIGATTMTAMAGLLVSAISAWLLAFVFVLSPTLERSIYPAVIAIRSVPAIAVAPIIVLWAGNGNLMRFSVAAFVTFFPILVYVLHGLHGPPKAYRDQFRAWKATPLQELLHLRVPWALPYFFASLRVASSYALAGAFIAEMMGANNGLGRVVMSAYYHFDAPTLFAGVTCFALIGIALFSLSSILETIALKFVPIEA